MIHWATLKLSTSVDHKTAKQSKKKPKEKGDKGEESCNTYNQQGVTVIVIEKALTIPPKNK